MMGVHDQQSTTRPQQYGVTSRWGLCARIKIAVGVLGVGWLFVVGLGLMGVPCCEGIALHSWYWMRRCLQVIGDVVSLVFFTGLWG